MSYIRPRTELATHTVENQPPALEWANAYEKDIVLQEAVKRGGGDWATDNLMSLGAKVFDPEWIDKAVLANTKLPELKRFNRFGQRVDTVEFHPAWHDVIGLAFEHEVHNMPWRANRRGGHVARGAAEILFAQLECGVLCPVDITYGIIPMLRQQPDLAEYWEPLMMSKEYDSRQVPHWEKKGISIAFTSTEKQGGSDIRRNTTFAKPVGQAGPGKEYTLHGHKFFCSAAGADIIFVVAQTEKGPGCFLVPRWLPDGSRNPISLERLKDKLGNKSNASTELEFDGTRGWLVGEEGRGIPTVMEFMLHTRFGCALIPAGMMRQALSQAIHHTRHRSAFQKRLVDQPLMRSVLADLAIESEATTTMMMRIAEAFDASATDPNERAFGRITVAVAKYWVNKRIVPFVHECLETHGGSGYIEESIMPRIYREAPIHGIWEGPGNVICLDIMRAFRKDPLSGEVFFAELEAVRGENRHLDATIDEVRRIVFDESMPEHKARYMAERMAMAMQAAQLIKFAPNYVSDAYCMTRLGGESGHVYGTIPNTVDMEAIIQRAWPE
ncbi:MAG: acyl-CoA dehydrogenase family protein [Rhodobiaceae bacterium]|nr:acyl-CoA dehydrogenase family protein [Rhodobiaceae bacterium]MCC0056180.1 acyl-CoA dehydrogenase family protein [Rhodobiaceae bacterium]